MPPPEPSPEEIYREIATAIQPLNDPLVGGPALNPDRKQQVLDGLRAAKAKHQMSDNGKIALSHISRDIETIMMEAKKQEYWRLLLGASEAYEILAPGNAKSRRYMEIAETQLARPKVKVKGFIEDKVTNDTYVFLDVKLPGSDWVTQEPVREGEEFLEPPHTLRLLEIIGNNKGVRLEYLAIEGDTFDVDAP